MKFMVAACQFKPILNQPAINLEKIEEVLRDMKHRHPDVRLAVLPELVTTGYKCGDRFFHLAESLNNSSSVNRLSRICREFHLHLIFGMAERDSQIQEIIYNSVICIDERGSLLGVYRKVHLTANELHWFKAGSSYPIFHTDLGNIGAFICWDTAFPEVARIYALQGAQLLTISSAWEHPHAPVWDLITAARAVDNILPVVAANRCGQEYDYHCFGHSRILDPLGQVIAKSDGEEEVAIVGEVDTQLSSSLRQNYFTFLKDRRPDTYTVLTADYPIRAKSFRN